MTINQTEYISNHNKLTSIQFHRASLQAYLPSIQFNYFPN